jgi:hypothetical protein
MCQLSNELSFELYKAQQEMLFYEKVIQMLYKELVNMDQRAQPGGSSRSELPDDQYRSSKPKDGWHQAHFTSGKMKSTRNSPLQIISLT